MPKLLLRPTLMPDEWWDSYVARTLAENGHAPTREYMLGKLEPFVAQLVSADEKRRAIAGDTVATSLRWFSRWTLPPWAVRGTKSAVAYCPSCLAEEPYVRISWRLRAVTHCAEHDLPLRTRCLTCGQPVFHWDLARGQCRCGAEFGTPLPRPGVRLSSDCANSGSEAPEGWMFSAQVAQEAISPVFDAAAGGAPVALASAVLIGHLLPALMKVRVAGQTPEDRTINGFLQGLGVSLSPSTTFVEETLESLRSAAHLRAALTTILSVGHAEASAQSALSMLPLQSWAEKLCAQGASPEKAERLGLVEPDSLKRGLVPLKVAAREAGLGEMHLHSLLARGVVTPQRTFEMGERQHLFSQEQVQSLMHFRHQGYGYGRSLDLGLAVSRIKVLRVAGVVNLVKGNGEKTWLNGEELRTLLVALGERAIEVDSVNGQMLCLGSDRIWQNRYVPALKTLFDRMLSGAVGLWAFGDQPGFARFYVGVDALELLHRGALVGNSQAVNQGPQENLALMGGKGHWSLTPTTWSRRPQLGAPRMRRDHSLQLTLAFE